MPRLDGYQEILPYYGKVARYHKKMKKIARIASDFLPFIFGAAFLGQVLRALLSRPPVDRIYEVAGVGLFLSIGVYALKNYAEKESAFADCQQGKLWTFYEECKSRTPPDSKRSIPAVTLEAKIVKDTRFSGWKKQSATLRMNGVVLDI